MAAPKGAIGDAILELARMFAEEERVVLPMNQLELGREQCLHCGKAVGRTAEPLSLGRVGLEPRVGTDEGEDAVFFDKVADLEQELLGIREPTEQIGGQDRVEATLTRINQGHFSKKERWRGTESGIEVTGIAGLERDALGMGVRWEGRHSLLRVVAFDLRFVGDRADFFHIVGGLDKVVGEIKANDLRTQHVEATRDREKSSTYLLKGVTQFKRGTTNRTPQIQCARALVRRDEATAVTTSDRDKFESVAWPKVVGKDVFWRS